MTAKALALLCALTLTLRADVADVAWDLTTLFDHIPPLQHDATGRWPMITWEHFTPKLGDRPHNRGEPLSAAEYQELARRGLGESIRLDAKYIPMALAMQQAGVKVIAMEGAGGRVPNTTPERQHQLPAGFEVKGKPYACPLLLAGWHENAMQLRQTLAAFTAAGVELDAAWLDWEHEPWWVEDRWQQAAACSRCQRLFPPGALDDLTAYCRFIARTRRQIFSTYLAAPIREFYPGCSVTNWGVVQSTPETPALHYWGRFAYPPLDTGWFSATNPVAYGNDIYVRIHWDKVWPDPKPPLDQAHMDRLYTYIMLAQVSANAANARFWAPDKLCAPWVARYCPDVGDAAIPILSRPRYREILRHIWLRGADTMQIFNAHRQNLPGMATEEIVDAVVIYDELLTWRRFLDQGEVMDTTIPKVDNEGAVWSGMLLADEALVRAFTQATAAVEFPVQPWPAAAAVTLSAPPAGAYYLLTRQADQVTATAVTP